MSINTKTLNRKRLFIIIGIILLLISLVPVPMMLTDGGTRAYSAILYTVYNRRTIWEEGGYHGHRVGIQVFILNVRVFDNTRFEAIGALEELEHTPNVRSVAIVSDGHEHKGFAHHWFFRSPCTDNTYDIDKRPEEVADELVPIPFGADFQIMIEGEQYRSPRYSFYKLTDSEWVRALWVYAENPYEVFLTHGHRWRFEEWEQVYAESFFDLLEPGEYILEVAVSWGTMWTGKEGQYFFWLTK